MANDVTTTAAPQPLALGLCLGCNYPLRGLSGRRCPECGRPFDPGDPRTMNLGKPVGRVARYVMRPIGRPTVVAGALATAAVLFLSRWPAGGAWPQPSLVDVDVVRRYFTWPIKLRPGEAELPAFGAALALWALVLGVWVLRVLLRTALARHTRQRCPQLDRRPRRHALLAGMLA